MKFFLSLSCAAALLVTGCAGDEKEGDTGSDATDTPTDTNTGTTGDSTTGDPAGDPDGDGLSNADEITLGTDPNVADSDGDGWNDGAEVDISSDPMNKFSWDFGGSQWPDFSGEATTDGVDGGSYGMGEVFPNFSATDQFGSIIDLYQFYGYVILLDFSAGWCGPCQDAAPGSQALWEDYREDGFLVIHAMIDGYGYPSVAEPSFLVDWADAFGLELPVIGGDDDPAEAVYYDLYNAGLLNGYVPSYVLLDADMNIDRIWEGEAYDQVEDRVLQLLGVDEATGGTTEPAEDYANPFTSYTGVEQWEYAVAQEEAGVYNCQMIWDVTGTAVNPIPGNCPECEFLFDVEATYDTKLSYDDGTCADIGWVGDHSFTYGYSSDYDGYNAWIYGYGSDYVWWGDATFTGDRESETGGEFTYAYGYLDYPYNGTYYSYNQYGTATVE